MFVRRVLYRYTLKNKELEQEGWDIIWVCGGCAAEDFVERAFLAHKLASKKQIYVGKIPMKPTHTAKHMVQFRARQLRSLEMHPAQYARLMSNSGHYVLGPEMVYGAAIPFMPLHSLSGAKNFLCVVNVGNGAYVQRCIRPVWPSALW